MKNWTAKKTPKGMNMNLRLTLTLFSGLAFLLCQGQNTNKISPQNVKHIVYLIGDAGHPFEDAGAVFNLLKKQVESDAKKSTVVFLGDNIYPGGMPDKGEKGRKEAEAILDEQLAFLEKLNIDLYFIPGNHDWDRGGKDGISTVRNEEKYIQENFRGGNIFLPSRGCPGPKKVKIGKDLVLYAIDTQWWLHPYEKPPIESADCSVSTQQEFIDELKDELNNSKDKNILVVGHHPIYSNGNHGGYFSFKDHLFPFTSVSKNLYIPLPVIGSLYPLYRSTVGHSTDIIHPEYTALKDGLLDAFENIDGLIYASGHEHNLQYYHKENQHFIVSGSGSETTYSSGKNGVDFSDASKGLFKLIYTKDGAVYLQAWETDDNGNQTLAFEKTLQTSAEHLVEQELEPINVNEKFPETVVREAGPQFEASNFKMFFWGKHYRDTWMAPVEFPVLNLNTEKGGLTPVKMGGRLQSKSLRVQSPDGNQYVLRSIKKFPERALPENMQHTLAANIFSDQISSSHPFAAYIIPPMAIVAKILHTNPRAVYIPDSPNLLYWRDDFGDELVLYEQRAAHDLSEFDNFGNAKDAIKSADLIEKIIEDHDFVVDEKEVLRNRLFDMFIGDFDRHEDQWRWAEFECKKDNHELCRHQKGIDKFYVPIPKDRDQAFVLFDGFFPKMVSKKWNQPRFQSFDYEINNLEGLNFNARYVDRFFLTRITKEEWVDMAEELKAALCDEIIENAVKLWPDTVFALDGQVVIDKLKRRRDDLPKYALAYYLFLSKEVNVLGSEKKELFEINRLSEDSTLVSVYKLKKNNKKQLHYKRMFYTHETKEIRLYGLGGKDQFVINGKVKKGILLRVIGGYGKDQIVDSSKVSGLRNFTQVYDTEKKTVIASGNETKVHTSKRKSSNAYNRKAWKPNVTYPRAFMGYTIDDGLFVGGGFEYVKQGFRKEPFKASHRLLANVALTNFSFNALYTGQFTDVLGKTDFRVDVLWSNPKTTNFFGYGNETAFKVTEENREEFVMRFNSISARGLFVFGNKKSGAFRIGPQYQYLNTVGAPDRFFKGDNAIIDADASKYIGATLDYEFKLQNKKVMPTRGIYFSSRATYNQEVSGKNISNLRLKSKLTFYVPLLNSLTYVINVSATSVIGDFEYYHSASLGGLNYTKDNDVLRGYRRDRYNGRTSFAFNNGLRLKLFKFKTVLFPGEMGISGFYDVGRVWVNNESSNIWHNNVGGGIWISIMDLMVINTFYSVSNEENVFRLVFGFLF